MVYNGDVVESLTDRGSTARGIVRGGLWRQGDFFVEVRWEYGVTSWDRPGTLRVVVPCEKGGKA